MQLYVQNNGWLFAMLHLYTALVCLPCYTALWGGGSTVMHYVSKLENPLLNTCWLLLAQYKQTK
ncbi:MAG: hypothetical protein EAY75_08370 [Bacteroidetes bacterium]|nr:MAG: hypothetical protein EAY75_08370 [Bacteroidota bacterium]